MEREFWKGRRAHNGGMEVLTSSGRLSLKTLVCPNFCYLGFGLEVCGVCFCDHIVVIGN